jgi:GAF domain-containing protein
VFNRWESILRRGEVVSAIISELPEEEKAILNLEEIRSIIVVPIFVGPDWWGIIGLDDCLSDRQWNRLEIEALSSAANIIGASLQQ